jgi:ribonuclease BN (tRNA processing enzyme)
MGYRVEYQGKSVTYASDTEPIHDIDKNLLELARDVDVLIHDCMFSLEQYRGEVDGISRKAWGHSTLNIPVDLARAANAKLLVLFHHGNEDSVIEQIERKAKELFPNSIAAYEGLEIEL